jgi:soluble lytic murein transglycosylase-like protein
MIELISSAALIISSMYGPVHAQESTSTASTTSSSTSIVSQTIDQQGINDPKAIMAYVKNYYADEPLLIEIARCESGFRQYDKDGNLVHGNVNKADIGVMQINETYHLERAKKLGYDITTVEGNVAYGRYLYENEGAAPWSASQKCWNNTLNTQVAVR